MPAPVPVTVKFGALVELPPVVPKVNVLAISAAAANPPVPLQVKPVTIAIDKLVAAAVVVVSVILLEPKLILRVFALVETKVPVDKAAPKANVPAVSVVVPAVLTINGPTIEVVPELLIVSAAIVPPFAVIEPVPTIVAVKLLNTPVLDNVKLLRFNVVAASVNAVVPKFNALNQLPVVSVGIAVPEPVNDRLTALVVVPPVVPNVNVLVISAAAVNPPVPIQVKPVAFAISKLSEAAVVVDNTILVVPKLILRVLVLFELNVPMVKLYPPKSNVP